MSVQSCSVIQIITSHVPWCLSSDNINRIKGFRTVADTGSSWTNSWQVCQNNPCFIHNSSYVYVWTVLEPPLPAFFCCNLQTFFFFVSRWEKALEEMINTHWAWWIGIISSQTQRKNVQKEKKLPLKCIHQYLQNQKQEEKSIRAFPD